MKISTKLFNLSTRTSNLNHLQLFRVNHHTSPIGMSMATPIYNSQQKNNEFRDTLPEIMETIFKRSKYAEVPVVASRIRKVFDYNVVNGKQIRRSTTAFAYETLAKPENINDETKKLVNILGWCVEMVHGSFLMMDDIMDKSETRRGRPCWYRVQSVGPGGAFNDAMLIYGSVFEILSLYFEKLPQYANLLTAFNEYLLYVTSGQYLDYEMAKRNKNNFSDFTLQNYNTAIKYKTGFTIHLPIKLAAIMANITDQRLLTKMTDISVEIGMYFQTQDDYIDCYSEESVSGKRSTDIREGKCTWLAVQALQRCNSAQRADFEANYGSQDPAHIDNIKRLYTTLQLPKLYEEYERTKYDEIVREAYALAPEVSPRLFLKIVEALNKRTR